MTEHYDKPSLSDNELLKEYNRVRVKYALLGISLPQPKFTMKNKVEDLRNHLFEQLERLSDDESFKNPLVQEREIKRTSAIVEIANAIIDSARAETEFLKVANENDSLLEAPFFKKQKEIEK